MTTNDEILTALYKIKLYNPRGSLAHCIELIEQACQVNRPLAPRI